MKAALFKPFEALAMCCAIKKVAKTPLKTYLHEKELNFIPLSFFLSEVSVPLWLVKNRHSKLSPHLVCTNLTGKNLVLRAEKPVPTGTR